MAGNTEGMRKQCPEDAGEVQKIPLLLTRPEESNAALADQFPPSLAEKIDFVPCPLMRIVALQPQFAMDENGAALFTSSNGVQFAPPSLGRRAFCVGERTSLAARNAGWKAVCAGNNAKGLIRYVSALRPKEPLYHFCGVHVRGGVVEVLSSQGLSAQAVVLYDQELLPLTAESIAVLNRNIPVIVPLFSPRAAAHFAAVSPANDHLRIVALSGAVERSVRKTTSFVTVTASEPTTEAMLSTIEKLL